MRPAGSVLGISTAGPVEVALLGARCDVVVASQRAALDSLVTLVRNVLRQGHAALDDLALIGVCTGPGSFTGLRIGAAFAKSLAQARELPIVGISAYDIAAFHIGTFPLIAVARGKPGYYYARILADRRAPPQFIQGPRGTIEQAAADMGDSTRPVSIVGPDFSTSQPGDGARNLALLAKQALEDGAERHWTRIAIDYGQRPNAVLNWEKRRGTREEGPSLSRRELQVE